MNQTCVNFFELSINELLLLNLILTFLLANGLNGNQLNILGNFLCSVGQNILVIQAVIGSFPDNEIYSIASNQAFKEINSTSCQDTVTTDDIIQQLATIKEQISTIEKALSSNKG